ncbi:S-layer homology domain-containing protein [Paenibacillus sp. J5C_2022]|uniref:RCC1 domain-containing protein n=1 Tax=Paenibacillus sp. J5C2022 TaxID=2977129 RepID=UPI0021CF1290|nr:S-layer homology domain-containing protein [Paenibacillus sp. J5C2022]MCU6709917.1 S-layer homology domain-containing protein [Paenibacillus sp. J5C2022]
MLTIKTRMFVHVAMILALLAGLLLPIGAPLTYAAEAGGGSRAVVKIAGGANHSLVLKADGSVVGWGYNVDGQTAVPTAAQSGVVAIAAGFGHSMALKSDGSVVAWGYNGSGQTTMPSAAQSGVVAIAAGYTHSLALKADGTVVAWGNNDSGQTTVSSAAQSGVVAIAAGRNHSMALKSDGTVVAWGDNNYGQTAVPSEAQSGVVAIAAGLNHSLALKADGTVIAWGYNGSGQTTVPSAAQSGVVAIAAGHGHSMALKSDGTVIAWGYNGSGRTNVPTEAQSGVVAIAAGLHHSIALKSDGTVVAWGNNDYGQTTVPVGLASPVKGSGIAAGRYHSLALKSDGTVIAWGNNDWGQTTVPSEAQSGVAAIAAGWSHSLALKTDGSVVGWGYNNYGQTTVPTEAQSGVVAIAPGHDHSLALKSDGTVVAWGDNTFGQTTVPAEGQSGIIAIAPGYYHSLALKSNGSVVAWGHNEYGQTTVPSEAQSGVVAIAAGGNHSLALKTDGSVIAWGKNGNGQSTVPSAAQSGVVAIGAGIHHSLALKADGTVVAWGLNDYGLTTVPTEAQSGVVAIAAGYYHSLALKSNGSVVGWGLNFYGQTTVPGSADLSGLTLQEGAFVEPFQPSVTAVTSYIGPSVSTVQVTATLADAVGGALFINNERQTSGAEVAVNVAGPSTVIPIRVEPYLLPSKTYTITVLRDSTPPDIQFSVNGNASSGKTAASFVTVMDAESGLDPASLQYAWTQSASVPVSGWSAFASGDTLTQASGDGSWYLHIRAADQAGNVQSQVSNPFELDNTKPIVTLSSAAGGTVNAAFPITVTFSEAASGFDESDIVVGNGTVSDFVSVTATVYSAVINPIASGQAVAVIVPAEVVTDAAGNGNEATTASYLYDTTKPTVVFDGFTANQIFTTPPAFVTVTVSEAVYWASDGAELTSANASALISVAKDGEPFADYTPTYDELSRTYTLTFNGPLGDGVYEVKVAGNAVENNIHNTLDASSMSLTIAVPVVIGISASPAILSSDGGNAAVAITGSNLAGQTVKVYVDGAESATANVDSAASAAATVAIPQNATTSDVIHTLTVYLNGVEVADQSATVTVSGKSITSNSSGTVSGPFIDNNGVPLDPDTIDTAKPSVTLEATPKDGVIYVSLPASVLTRFEGNNAAFIIKIQAPYGSYQVPVHLASLIPGLKELLAADGLQAEDISFKITLTDKSGDRGIQTALASDLPKGKVMGAIVDFRIDILNPKTGQTIGTADQFSKALTRVIPMPKNRSGMPSQWGAFRYNEETGKFDFVTARSMRIDGTWYVMISSHSNSMYVVADNAVSFTDIQKHWAQSYVELAAAKGLVNGAGSGKYRPDKAVTRAEFTSMLVRALGRGTSTGITEPYDDVKSGTWYYGDVATAKELGLLDFVNGTSFKPDQPLTRVEMASMLAAVIALEKLPFTKERVSLYGYKDINDIDKAYLEDVRLMVKLQIMTGIDADMFSPKGETTRAQAAVVFIRTMRTLGMIDG